MIATRRQKRIIEILNREGQADVPRLCELLGVSEATVRRDLAALAEDNLLKRVRGGAIAANKVATEPPVLARQRENSGEKAAIGCAAAALISEGDTVFIGSGSTTIEVAKSMKNRHDLREVTVITNSVPIINIMLEDRRFSLVLVGGYVRHGEHSAIGWIAEQTLKDLHADKVVIGIGGLSVQNGLLSAHIPEVLTDRAILQLGGQIIVVADHTKFSRSETVRLAPISVVHTIVTDDQVAPVAVEEFRSMGIEVVVAAANKAKMEA